LTQHGVDRHGETQEFGWHGRQSISMKPSKNPPKMIWVPTARVMTAGIVIRIISLGTSAPKDE
jgi:hypothetical protein